MAPNFHLPSAKNLTIKKAVEYFVPTDLFWEVLGSDSHDVLYGTRGSGKTMLLRMMSVQHLHAYGHSDERAAEALYTQRRFGMFIPLGLDWCVAYPDLGIEGQERLFVDGINLAVADAFVEALDFLVDIAALGMRDYVSAERDIASALAELWFRPAPSKLRLPSFLSLRNLLARHQAILTDLWRHGRPPTIKEERDAGFLFRSSALFAPLALAARAVNDRLELGVDQRWLVCLDELEDLKPFQIAEIATALRGNPQGLVFKITTQPYSLDGTTTHFSADASAVDFRDYNVRRLQNDPHRPEYEMLAAAILRKRLGLAEADAQDLPRSLFGQTTFADRAESTDPGFKRVRQAIMTVEANRLDSVRKKVPVAAVRSLRRQAEGHRRSIAYSGWKTLVAISDGNPGMLVRLLNELNVGPGAVAIEPARQHRTVVELAEAWHEWTQALYTDGPVLHRLLAQLGTRLSERLHAKRDQETEVQEELNRFVVDLQGIPSRHAEAFRVAARHGLLVAEAAGSSLRYPLGAGVWRLSYALAPKFWLLTRRGRIGRMEETQLELGFDAGSDPDIFVLPEAEALVDGPGGMVEEV